MSEKNLLEKKFCSAKKSLKNNIQNKIFHEKKKIVAKRKFYWKKNCNGFYS